MIAKILYGISTVLFIWMLFAMFIGYIFDDISWWYRAG